MGGKKITTTQTSKKTTLWYHDALYREPAVLTYLSFQVQLLHFLVTISYSNKCTWLRLLFRTTIAFHLFFFFLPSTAHKIHTRRRAKKPKTMRGEETQCNYTQESTSFSWTYEYKIMLNYTKLAHKETFWSSLL